MEEREQLIESLVQDLRPRPKQLSIVNIAIVWWLMSWLYVVVMTILIEPPANGVVDKISSSLQFQVESLLGLVASFLITLAAWRGSVPGVNNKPLLYTGCGLLLLWVCTYVVGFYEPAIEPSMVGKRGYCFIESFIYSIPTMLFACWLVAKRYTFTLWKTGFLIGLAAGMMPALFMQFACMYEPKHILLYHILPGVVAAFIGVAVLPLINRCFHQ